MGAVHTADRKAAEAVHTAEAEEAYTADMLAELRTASVVAAQHKDCSAVAPVAHKDYTEAAVSHIEAEVVCMQGVPIVPDYQNLNYYPSFSLIQNLRQISAANFNYVSL